MIHASGKLDAVEQRHGKHKHRPVTPAAEVETPADSAHIHAEHHKRRIWQPSVESRRAVHSGLSGFILVGKPPDINHRRHDPDSRNHSRNAVCKKPAHAPQHYIIYHYGYDKLAAKQPENRDTALHVDGRCGKRADKHGRKDPDHTAFVPVSETYHGTQSKSEP